MNMKTPAPASAVTTAAAVLAAGLALAGCASSTSSTSPVGAGATGTATSGASAASTASASASAAASGSLPFPVAMGNTWTYKITSSGESGTTINKMTAVTPAAGGQRVTMATTDHLASVNTSAKETYVFGSDGSIIYPLNQIQPGTGVTVSGNGVVWPPASVLDSGKPSKSNLKLSVKVAGQTISTTAHITVQGAGTQTVTVPAGTYQATVLLMTETVAVQGIAVTDEVKVWLAPGVGPVKDEVLANQAGTAHVTVTEELESFMKG
jgi:hypothetical protein